MNEFCALRGEPAVDRIPTRQRRTTSTGGGFTRVLADVPFCEPHRGTDPDVEWCPTYEQVSSANEPCKGCGKDLVEIPS